MVALPKLQKCFGCASLRTGTLIIGALSLVSSLVGILASIGFLAGSTARVDLVVQLLDHLPGQNVDVNCVACDDLDRQFILAGTDDADADADCHYQESSSLVWLY